MTDSILINGPLPPQQLTGHPALLGEGYQICVKANPVLKATGTRLTFMQQLKMAHTRKYKTSRQRQFYFQKVKLI